MPLFFPRLSAFFQKLSSWLLNLLFGACCLALLYFLLQLFCFTSFKIPSYSMMPTLIDGDRILVNKLTMGARLFNVFAALRGEQVAIHRMPGCGSLKRGDVVVFNFPYGSISWDSIRMDVMQYYVKRCIALPGDTVEIRGGYYHVRGYSGPLGNKAAQAFIAGLHRQPNLPSGVIPITFPNDGRGWNIWTFGPLPVPRAGQVVQIDSLTYPLYRQLIGWEQKRRLRWIAGRALLGDSLITRYRFTKNYYFVSGDNTAYSQDSRYWGMLPEEYIVGKVTCVWYSEERDTHQVRWDRLMKKVR
ncbi:MAG: signal peptidase I [Mediterranea sp.]|nr:signal peptidase I [Mediterranea sp.]